MEEKRRKKRWRYSQEQIQTKDLKKCVEKTGWKTKRKQTLSKRRHCGENGEDKQRTTTPFTEYIETRQRNKYSKRRIENTRMCLSGLGVLVEDSEDRDKPETVNLKRKPVSSWIRNTTPRKDMNTSITSLTIEGSPVSIPKKKVSSREYFPSTFVHESRLLRVRGSKNIDLYTPDNRFGEALMAPWTRRGIVDSIGDDSET